MLVLYLIRFGCQYFITTWGHIMGARMESNMRQDLFDHLQRLSFSYYDKNNTGEMMSKLLRIYLIFLQLGAPRARKYFYLSVEDHRIFYSFDESQC